MKKACGVTGFRASPAELAISGPYCRCISETGRLKEFNIEGYFSERKKKIIKTLLMINYFEQPPGIGAVWPAELCFQLPAVVEMR